jgi:hypothetical protein
MTVLNSHKMKRIIKDILVLVFLFGFYSCEKPAPTELTQDENISENNLEIEIIPTDSPDLVYSNGYDSTAITSPIPKYSSIISVGDVKTTYKSKTINSVLAQAIFFDKGQPVNIRQGRVIGYRTRTLGSVFFDDRRAGLVPYIIHFRDFGAVKDSSVGSYHLLYKRENIGDHINFRYESSIDFKLKVLGSLAVNFQIPTPKEIIGEAEVVAGTAGAERNYLLNWNGSNKGKIDIVIGGIKKTSYTQEIFPFFKLRTPDDGRLLIPSYLLKDFPYSQYNKIVFTFIRQITYDYEPNNTLDDHSITAQSIHSVLLDIP